MKCELSWESFKISALYLTDAKTGNSKDHQSSWEKLCGLIVGEPLSFSLSSVGRNTTLAESDMKAFLTETDIQFKKRLEKRLVCYT